MFSRLQGRPPARSMIDRKRQFPSLTDETPTSSRIKISSNYRVNKLEKRLQTYGKQKQLEEPWGSSSKIASTSTKHHGRETDDSEEELFEQMGSSDNRVSENESNSDDDGTRFHNDSHAFSSERNQWNPSALMRNTCYDKTTGRLLSKAQCDLNLTTAMKKKRSINYYEVLQRSNSSEACTLSFCLYMLNRVMKKEDDRSSSSQFQPKSAFNLEAAKSVDNVTSLPAGKQVLLSSLIFPHMCSNWVGNSGLSNAIISILKEIESRDEYFKIYSSPESDRSTCYPLISSDFFGNFADVLKAGFDVLGESKSAISLVSSIRRSTRNYIDKLRRSVTQGEVASLLKSFTESTSGDPQFRSSEPPIQECPSRISNRKARKFSNANGIPMRNVLHQNIKEETPVVLDRLESDETEEAVVIGEHAGFEGPTNQHRKSKATRNRVKRAPSAYSPTPDAGPSSSYGNGRLRRLRK